MKKAELIDALIAHERTPDAVLAARSISNSANDAIITINPRSEILTWNPAATRIFGYTEDEAIGKLIHLIIAEHLHQAHTDGVARVTAGGPGRILGKTVEVQGRRKNGEIFPVELSVATWVGDSGRLFSGILRDITERKRAERENAEKSAVMKATLENLAQGIAMFDRDLKSVAFNQLYVTMQDFPPDLIRIGVSIEKIFRFNAERGEYGVGDVDEIIRERMDRAWEFEPHQFERSRPDGTVLEVQGTPVESGGFVTTYTDITDRKRMEIEIAEQARRLELTLENMEEGILLLDTDYNIILHNGKTARLLGIPDKLLAAGTNFETLVAYQLQHDEYDDAFNAKKSVHLEEVSRGNLQRDVYERQRPDGSWLHVVSNPLPEGGVLRTFQDITERKRAEAELAQTEAHLRSALDNMSGGIYMVDVDLRLRVFNDDFARLFEIPDGVIVKNASIGNVIRIRAERGDYGPGDPEDLIADRLQGFWDLSETAYLEDVVPSGRVIGVRRALTDDGGVVAVFSDITERKQAEAALRESEERLRGILDHSPVAISIIRSGTAESRLYRNASYDRMFQGDTDLPLVTVSDSFVDPGDRERIYAGMENGGLIDSIEMRRRRTDGETIWDLMSTQHAEYEGGPADIIWHIDITDRKRAEAALRESEERLREILDHSPVAISMVRSGTDESRLYHNASYVRMYQGDTDLPLVTVLDSYVDSEDLDRLNSALEKDGFVDRVEVRRRRTDGETIWALMSSQRAQYEGGPANIIWHVDVTARKRPKPLREKARYAYGRSWTTRRPRST